MFSFPSCQFILGSQIFPRILTQICSKELLREERFVSSGRSQNSSASVLPSLQPPVIGQKAVAKLLWNNETVERLIWSKVSGLAKERKCGCPLRQRTHFGGKTPASQLKQVCSAAKSKLAKSSPSLKNSVRQAHKRDAKTRVSLIRQLGIYMWGRAKVAFCFFVQEI